MVDCDISKRCRARCLDWICGEHQSDILNLTDEMVHSGLGDGAPPHTEITAYHCSTGGSQCADSTFNVNTSKAAVLGAVATASCQCQSGSDRSFGYNCQNSRKPAKRKRISTHPQSIFHQELSHRQVSQGYNELQGRRHSAQVDVPSNQITAADDSNRQSSCKKTASPGRHLLQRQRDQHQCQCQFLGHLYVLLNRLSPSRRREIIAMRLTEPQRLELETWILNRKKQSRVLDHVCADQSGQSSSLELQGLEDSSHVPMGICYAPHSLYDCPSALPQAQQRHRGSKFKQVRGTPHARGVHRFAQDRAHGRMSVWYFASICLPGLQIVCHMHRERAAAVRDRNVLMKVKLLATSTIRTGVHFDDAVRQAFHHFGIFFQPARALIACAKQTKMMPTLRFYAAITLTSSYKTQIRSPAFRDLEGAVNARRRLLQALGNIKLADSPHTECMTVLGRLRTEYMTIHAATQSHHKKLQTAHKTFDRVWESVLDDRDTRCIGLVEALLQAQRQNTR